MKLIRNICLLLALALTAQINTSFDVNIASTIGKNRNHYNMLIN